MLDPVCSTRGPQGDVIESPVSLGESERELVGEALAFVHALADEITPDLLAWFGEAKGERKADGSLVSVADVATNERIVATVAQRFPAHEVVSEEIDTAYHGGEWAWVVDPVDGTTNFVRGVPTWTVSIALAYRGWPVLGLVDVPALGRRYHATQDDGAYRDGHRIEVRDADLNDPATVDTTLLAVSSGIGRSYTVRLPLRSRSMGSAALHLAMVADGSAVASVHRGPRVWDVAAGHVLVREAGGVLLPASDSDVPFPMDRGEHRQRPYRFVAAASAQSAQAVRDAVRQV